ncbi:MAG TPA: type II toxin-antitoxin system HicA family toxin [Frankiaceae bacterium]|nr:type II toxin-antitoxin system HicA family toxin [Frankiaceae bacterium]
MTYREVIRRMKERACSAERVRVVGSHERWVVDRHCGVTVPRHRGDLTPGTLASIQRQAAHCLGDGWLR